MDTLFAIVDVASLGDFDGESHIVTLRHRHPEGEPGTAIARFGTLRAGEATATCSECGAAIRVMKANGGADIYTQE